MLDRWREAVAALVVAGFVAVALFRFARGELSMPAQTVLLITVLTSVATVYGMEKLTAVMKAWRGN